MIMEILVIAAVLWLIGCLHPGSSQPSGGPDFADFATFAACGALVVGLVFVYCYALAGVMIAGKWLGLHDGVTTLLALFGPIALPMGVAGIVNARA